MNKPIILVRNNLDKALKALRRSFDNDIAPLLRRHQHYRSKSQIRRVKWTLRVLGTKRVIKIE